VLGNKEKEEAGLHSRPGGVVGVAAAEVAASLDWADKGLGGTVAQGRNWEEDWGVVVAGKKVWEAHVEVEVGDEGVAEAGGGRQMNKKPGDLRHQE
jgi:hypothetical protein